MVSLPQFTRKPELWHSLQFEKSADNSVLMGMPELGGSPLSRTLIIVGVLGVGFTPKAKSITTAFGISLHIDFGDVRELEAVGIPVSELVWRGILSASLNEFGRSSRWRTIGKQIQEKLP